MYGRGRGRGKIFGGGARQEPFVLFPDIALPDRKDVKMERELFHWSLRLENHWKSSPYYLEENVTKKGQSMEIERYSDMVKPKTTWKRGSLHQFLQLGSNKFPKELDGGLKRGQDKKKVRWDPGLDLLKLDIFEKKEQNSQGNEKGEKEKKEGEDEDEEEDEEAKSADEEYSDDGDYNENEHFDDDEDDFNQDDGGDDEGIL